MPIHSFNHRPPMEASPFHHPFLSFSDPMTTTTTNTIVTGYCAEFHQPYEQAVPTSSIASNLQILDSSMSMAVVHAHKSDIKMPCTQSDIRAKTACKRRSRQKKNNDDQENKKKMTDSNGIGYIHVRARRGEATDSHSLAERVRREKISAKMKALQSIVPGCDKITGKALMLEEVINYVQSLQNEIQILSLKLASVSPMLYYGAEYEQCMLTPHDQNMSTIQQQLLSFQEHQIPCMISQDNGEAYLWDLEEQRQELDDLFAIINGKSCY